MPIVRIDLVRGHDAAWKKAILDGVHSALVEAFRIPEHDRNQILSEHAPEDFERAAGRGPGFVLVEITAFPGRSAEAKVALFSAIVRNLKASPGVDPSEVLIVVHEPPLSNWGVRGGQAGDRVDLGFKLDV